MEAGLPGQSFQYFCLKFDEFLTENIHSQLANLHDTRVFRFQSFLLRMFLSYNEDNLQAPGLVITDDMTKNYYEFMNFLWQRYMTFYFKKDCLGCFLR